MNRLKTAQKQIRTTADELIQGMPEHGHEAFVGQVDIGGDCDGTLAHTLYLITPELIFQANDPLLYYVGDNCTILVDYFCDVIMEIKPENPII